MVWGKVRNIAVEISKRVKLSRILRQSPADLIEGNGGEAYCELGGIFAAGAGILSPTGLA